MRDPLHHWVPPHEESYGNLAAGVAAQLGIPMDDEQRMILDAIYAEDEPGVPTCFEVGVVAPRQNLKTATLEIAALTDAFVLGVPLHVWTAHLFPTARKSFEHMVALIASSEDFRGRCEWPPRASHGEESIQLLTGEKIEFHARSTGGGRGFAGVSKVTSTRRCSWAQPRWVRCCPRWRPELTPRFATGRPQVLPTQELCGRYGIVVVVVVTHASRTSSGARLARIALRASSVRTSTVSLPDARLTARTCGRRRTRRSVDESRCTPCEPSAGPCRRRSSRGSS